MQECLGEARASRYPRKVPQTAHAVTSSLGHSRKSVGDLGLVQCDSRVTEKPGDIFGTPAYSKCTTRSSPPISSPPISMPLTSAGVRVCKRSVLGHQLEERLIPKKEKNSFAANQMNTRPIVNNISNKYYSIFSLIIRNNSNKKKLRTNENSGNCDQHIQSSFFVNPYDNLIKLYAHFTISAP